MALSIMEHFFFSDQFFDCDYTRFQGSISISMSLYQTSFCFVCSHLSSGEKEGDEIRRNSDVMEILKKTHFPPIPKFSGEKTPESILEHE